MKQLLDEWIHEAQLTRKVLERVPQAKLSWKPHAKSMSIGELAQHIANTPSWAKGIFESDEFVMTGERLDEPKTVAQILERFDANDELMRQMLSKESDFAKVWSLKAGDKVVLSMPRGTVVRSFLFSHMIHHRGQLSVYLRLLDVPVPSIYGPSADEH